MDRPFSCSQLQFPPKSSFLQSIPIWLANSVKLTSALPIFASLLSMFRITNMNCPIIWTHHHYREYTSYWRLKKWSYRGCNEYSTQLLEICITDSFCMDNAFLPTSHAPSVDWHTIVAYMWNDLRDYTSVSHNHFSSPKRRYKLKG